MTDRESYHQRFIQDALPIRLGGISANLARVQSASGNPRQSEVVRDMVRDTEYLIEWTAAECDPEVGGELVELQIQLAVWYRNWVLLWQDADLRNVIATMSGKWSDRVLELSGLLNEN